MISHALAVRKAVAHRDYHQLFKLYRNYPQNMSPYLIDHFVERERISALRIMCVAYKSSQLHVAFVAEELGWIGPTGVDDCVKQLEEWKIPLQPVPLAADDMELDNNGGATSLKIDTKEGARIVNGLWSKVGLERSTDLTSPNAFRLTFPSPTVQNRGYQGPSLKFSRVRASLHLTLVSQDTILPLSQLALAATEEKEYPLLCQQCLVSNDLI